MDFITIRKLAEYEKNTAMQLSWDVFVEFDNTDCREEGLKSFRSFIDDNEMVDKLDVYGAFDADKLIGIIATRDTGGHISLFFVNKKFHCHGVGRSLFNSVLENSNAKEITVNSSRYAVEFYHKLGFTDVDKEQLTDGIRYTPMKYIR